MLELLARMRFVRARALRDRGSQEALASRGRSISAPPAKVTALVVYRLIRRAPTALLGLSVRGTTLARAFPTRSQIARPLKVSQREARRWTTRARRAPVGRSTRSLIRSRALRGRPQRVLQGKDTRPVQNLLMRLARHAAQANTLPRTIRRRARCTRYRLALKGHRWLPGLLLATPLVRAHVLRDRGSQEAPASRGRSTSAPPAKVTALAAHRLTRRASTALLGLSVRGTTLARAFPIRSQPVRPLKVSQREARRQTTRARRTRGPHLRGMLARRPSAVPRAPRRVRWSANLQRAPRSAARIVPRTNPTTKFRATASASAAAAAAASTSVPLS